jgi:hypothetical protein
VKAPRRRRGEVGSKPTLGANQTTDDRRPKTDERHLPNPTSVIRPLSSDHGVSAGAQARLASKPAGVRLPVTPPFFRSKPSKAHGAAC